MTLRTHEETLVHWWDVIQRRSCRETWLTLSDWCYGASTALMDVHGKLEAVIAFNDASMLARARADLCRTDDMPLVPAELQKLLAKAEARA